MLVVGALINWRLKLLGSHQELLLEVLKAGGALRCLRLLVVVLRSWLLGRLIAVGLFLAGDVR